MRIVAHDVRRFRTAIKNLGLGAKFSKLCPNVLGMEYINEMDFLTVITATNIAPLRRPRHDIGLREVGGEYKVSLVG